MPKNPKGSSLSYKKKYELPEDRLATTSEKGERVYLYPAEVHGFYRKARHLVNSLLILIFLGLPWIHVNHQQLILLDLPNRKFNFFGFVFWAHDAPILFLVIISFAIAIAFVTAVFGRVWCGWACPQTVFIDGVFRKIEEWVEGKSAHRKRVDQQPWTFRKFYKKCIKWFLFLIASLMITHSFLAYFVGSVPLIEMIMRPPTENWTPFVVILFTTAIILFDFAWFREQFCIIACPYGRLQSVLMDENSLIIAYDDKRGEPRRDEGDCVDCYRCVQVCPTGIDIRRGVQMECIMCTACIDACDEIMFKTHREPKLIRFDTENGLAGKKVNHIRIRIYIYCLALVISLATFVMIVIHKEKAVIHLVRMRDVPFQLIQNQRVSNHFKLAVKNQYDYPIHVQFKLDEDIQNQLDIEIIQPLSQIPIESGKDDEQDIFIRFKKQILNHGSYTLKVHKLVFTKDQLIDQKKIEVKLIGPLS